MQFACVIARHRFEPSPRRQYRRPQLQDGTVAGPSFMLATPIPGVLFSLLRVSFHGAASRKPKVESAFIIFYGSIQLVNYT